jgi:hypothetical protein
MSFLSETSKISKIGSIPCELIITLFSSGDSLRTSI